MIPAAMSSRYAR